MDDLVERLRDDETFVRQRACHNCTKGFENHEYHCTRGPRCIDGEDVLKACRKRWRSERKEAAAEITRLREENKSLNDECNKSMIEIENLRQDIETARRDASDTTIWNGASVADIAYEMAKRELHELRELLRRKSPPPSAP